MERIPAVAGWHWIKQGFALFRRQPSELSTLFVLCCCLKLLLSVIPVLGLVLWFLLIPPFSMAFMVACNDIEHEVRVHPRVLFAGFHGPAVKRLLGLGACYFAAMLVAVVVTHIIDDGYLLNTLMSQVNDAPVPDAKTTEDTRLAKSVLFLMATYLIATLPLWFASPLIAWRNMSIGKAIFFSFFSMIRAIKAFALYALCWLFISVFVNVSLSALLQLLQIDNFDVGLFLLMPMFLLLTVVMYCSYYASYAQIFGAPEQSLPSGELPG
jgi:hypothetical protein